MTLSRILAAVISALMAVVFAGTLLINIRSTRDYVAEQLVSHAEDTATSLGLSITAAGAGNDAVTVQSMVDAIFDRGYYREITVTAINGRPIVERTVEVDVADVPAWFVRAVPLHTPRGDSVVMDGWKEVAKIHVASHPGYAYSRLWNSAYDLACWFAFAWLAGVVLLVIALRVLMSPLRAVEQQAQAIGNRQFTVVERVPRARELRRVVEAMNAMSGAIKSMFGEQARLIERTREEAQRDTVTGFALRNAFMTRLKHLMRTPDEFGRGVLVLLHVDGLRACSEINGRTAGDALLAEVAARIVRAVPIGAECIFGRLEGATLVVLICGTEPENQDKIPDMLKAAVASLPVMLTIGIADSGNVRSADELLGAAESSFLNAKSMAACPVIVPIGRGALEDVVVERIARGAVSLHYQALRSAAGQGVVHHEVLVRLADSSGRLMYAGEFMTTVRRLGLTTDLDRCVLEKLSGLLDQPSHAKASFAVNLSETSLHDGRFVQWLSTAIPESARSRLTIEVPQRDLELAGLTHAFADLDRLGFRYALDHFGAEFRAFESMVDLPLAYIKIDGSLIQDMATRQECRGFVMEVVRMARAIGLPVYATGVEEVADYDAALMCGVSGLQGYLIEAPQDLPATFVK